MNTIRISICILFISVLAACNPTKHLPEGEALYTGATVNLQASGVAARQSKVLKADLQGMTRPRPNSRFLGIPFKLGIYNMFRNAKPNSFFGRFRDKNGQPPVLVSSVDLENNVTLLRGHLENKGFFKATVTGDTIVKGKKGRAEYTAKAGEQYKINTVRFQNDSSALAKAIQESAAQSFLKPNDPYDLDVIRGERNRIDAYLKERGFYYFSPDHLIIKVDSNLGTNRVDMLLQVKEEAPANAKQPYTIDDVYIYSNYNLNNAREDTSKANARLYEGYHVVDRRNRFKPKMFAQVMQFKPGELYNRTDHNQTLNRLINLNEFKFVRNRFEPVADEDSAKLDAYYYLTPLPKKSLRAEINTTTKSNNLSGTALQFSWRNRNTFRAGEHLSISAYIGTETQFGGKNDVDDKGDPIRYPTYRSGAELNFAIPRFVIPFFNIRTRGNFVPRTNIQLGYDIVNRRGLYTINSFRGGLGYLWKPSLVRNHEFYPISINYVQPINVTAKFQEEIREHPYLQRVVDSQFVLGSTYQFTYNELATGLQKRNAFYFMGLADLSGNIAGLVTGANIKEGNEKRIFNAAFNQYIKLEVDGRYYRKIGVNSSWVNRVNIGLGRPYGNSLELPYIKQFFSGGNNSIRAFRSRSLGPGTFREVNNTNFFNDQTGDIKLEFNTEFRPHISGPLYGAVFIDAGNVWLANEDPTRPGGKFSKDFLNELAVGGGLGVRLDIQLFVIRLDVGVPFRKPWEQNPWVMNQIRTMFDEREWRRENIIYNLAIGYPF
jgi:outer membrane protein insertion porin family